LRGQDAAEQATFDGDASSGAETTGEAFGLIEFAFAQFSAVKGNGDDDIPFCCRQGGGSATEKQFGQKRLETESALIFLAVNNVQNVVAGDDCRTSEGEAQFKIAAIGAFEDCGNLSFVGEAAGLTEGRIDESEPCAAIRTDKTFCGCRPRTAAKLTDFGITESQSGIEPIFDGLRQCGHKGGYILVGNQRKERDLCMIGGGVIGDRPVDFKWRIVKVRDK
jgi:hypothetical protein